jgi:hypothetical protein
MSHTFHGVLQKINDGVNSITFRARVITYISRDIWSAYNAKVWLNLDDKATHNYSESAEKANIISSDVVFEVTEIPLDSKLMIKILKNRFGHTGFSFTVSMDKLAPIKYFSPLDEKPSNSTVHRDYLTNEQLQAAIESETRHLMNCGYDKSNYLEKLISIQLKRAEG